MINKVMTLEEYKKHLVKVWFIGFTILALLLVGAKWWGYYHGEATSESLWREVAGALFISFFLPSLLILRAYFRYKRWLKETQET